MGDFAENEYYEINASENIGDRNFEEKSGGPAPFKPYCPVVTSERGTAESNGLSSSGADVTREGRNSLESQTYMLVDQAKIQVDLRVQKIKNGDITGVIKDCLVNDRKLIK